MRFSFLPIIVLMMPILEIAGFIIVGKAIGLWLTLALV
ncbi:MAG: membrane protein FxsA, partial [Rhizobium pusense]|nr:membrane protein FxsA [Agrobacterium pusense]